MRRPLHDSTNYPVPGTISRLRRRTPAPRGTFRAKLRYVLFPLVWAAVLLGLHQAYADHYAINPGDVVVEGTVIGSDDGRQIGRPSRQFAVVAGLFGLIGAGRLVKLLGTELGQWRRTRRTT